MDESIGHYAVPSSSWDATGEADGLRCEARCRRLIRRYLDTPDWRLFHGETVLELEEEAGRCRLRWRSLGAGGVLHGAELPRAPHSAADLPAGVFRDELGAATQGRLLQVIVGEALDVRSCTLAGPGADEDTRLDLESSRPEYRVDAEPLIERIRTRRRGDSGGDAVTGRLAALGCPPGAEPLLELLEAQGMAPAPKNKMPRIRRSDPGFVAGIARVETRLLERIEAQEPGLYQDGDCEFLHEFRIACRRSRSLFPGIAKRLSKARRRRLREDFRWLSRLSGPLRDLDVLLEHFDTLAGPPPQAPGAGRIRRRLESQRRQAAAALRSALRSRRYRSFKRRWRHCLTELQRTTQARDELAGRAAQFLAQMHERVLDQVHRLERDLNLAEFHELRKRCKQLRYRLDACRPLLPAAEVRANLAALKRLQDALGEINDRDIQRRLLAAARDEVAGEGGGAAAPAWADRLIARLGRETQLGLEHIRPELTTFAAPANRERFRRMLAAPAR